MKGLLATIAAAAAALALAAPGLADVGRPADVYKDAYAKDAFAKDAFRAHPASSSWNALRPLGEKWSIGYTNSWN